MEFLLTKCINTRVLYMYKSPSSETELSELIDRQSTVSDISDRDDLYSPSSHYESCDEASDIEGAGSDSCTESKQLREHYSEAQRKVEVLQDQLDRILKKQDASITNYHAQRELTFNGTKCDAGVQTNDGGTCHEELPLDENLTDAGPEYETTGVKTESDDTLLPRGETAELQAPPSQERFSQEFGPVKADQGLEDDRPGNEDAVQKSPSNPQVDDEIEGRNLEIYLGVETPCRSEEFIQTQASKEGLRKAGIGSQTSDCPDVRIVTDESLSDSFYEVTPKPVTLLLSSSSEFQVSTTSNLEPVVFMECHMLNAEPRGAPEKLTATDFITPEGDLNAEEDLSMGDDSGVGLASTAQSQLCVAEEQPQVGAAQGEQLRDVQSMFMGCRWKYSDLWVRIRGKFPKLFTQRLSLS